MKYLLPLLLACMLLCGCTQASLPEETGSTLPTESVAGETSAPEEYGGAVQTVPLNLRKVRGLRIFGGKLLLFSGQGATTLTLLDGDTFAVCAGKELDFQLEPEDPSLRFHEDGTLSFFDPGTEETVVLDAGLAEIRRIAVPGALTGAPILSRDGRTLFYCTASHVRAWDLETGIRRCIKEMSFGSQILIDVLDGVLQCQVTDGLQTRTLFLSAENGRLLRQCDGIFSVHGEKGRYYASVPAGTYRVPVFGDDPDAPQMLIPGDFSAAHWFLPLQHGAVTAQVLPDDRAVLNWYDLSSGLRRFSLTLGMHQLPRSVECLDADTLVLLSYDPASDREFLTLWELRENCPSAVQDSTCRVEPYYPAAAPDTAGLARLQREADLLGKKYGIHVLLGDEAAGLIPRDYSIAPEHLIPVLQQELTQLEQRLAQFPEQLLTETAAHFSDVNLCLVRSLTGVGDPESANGLQFLNGADAYVVIPTGVHAEQALYHSLFHLMETHIFSESKAFDRWDSLNPAGFRYDYDYAANAVRDSGVYLFEENRAFVDTYSMSYPKEDRARIMEYAMLPGNESLFRPAQMQRKLQQLCTGIREAYALKHSEEVFPWEQYLE